MCGRYASFIAPGELQLQFDLSSISEAAERFESYNVAPSTDVPIIIQRPDTGAREVHMARWGLVPPWAKELGSGPLMFNARVETAAEKRTFAPALAKRRCIFPMSGYFEWQAGTAGGGKQPYFIFDAARPVTAMAGLYGWWHQPDGSWLLSATIMTRAASPEMAAIHNREPVVLEPEEYAAWLDPARQDPRAALALISREPPALEFYPVRKEVGNVANNEQANVERIEAR